MRLAQITGISVVQFKQALVHMGLGVVPNGTADEPDYKEVLVTMPTTRSKIAQRRSELAAIDRERPLTENEQKEYNELQSKWRKDEGVFKSSHFDEPNILVHLRMNTRTDSDGNKVLFLEEVQSDWGQKGKKEGFANIDKLPYGYRNGRHSSSQTFETCFYFV